GNRAWPAHGVRVRARGGPRDAHRLGQLPLIVRPLALERHEHEPDRDCPAGLLERLVERTTHRPGATGHLETDRPRGGGRQPARLAMVLTGVQSTNYGCARTDS